MTTNSANIYDGHAISHEVWKIFRKKKYTQKHSLLGISLDFFFVTVAVTISLPGVTALSLPNRWLNRMGPSREPESVVHASVAPLSVVHDC
jgi:hypothetical protein